MKIDARVNLSAADITLADALSQITKPLGLGYCVQEGLIVITSRERCGGPLTSRVYPLPQPWVEELQAGTATSKELLDRVRRTSEPAFWSDQGGRSQLAIDGRTNAVVVYASERQHAEIERSFATESVR